MDCFVVLCTSRNDEFVTARPTRVVAVYYGLLRIVDLRHRNKSRLATLTLSLLQQQAHATLSLCGLLLHCVHRNDKVYLFKMASNAFL